MNTRIEASLSAWKAKAKQRREENKNLQKRVEESRESRDYWKAKYKELAEHHEAIELELKKK